MYSSKCKTLIGSTRQRPWRGRDWLEIKEQRKANHHSDTSELYPNFGSSSRSARILDNVQRLLDNFCLDFGTVLKALSGCLVRPTTTSALQLTATTII